MMSRKYVVINPANYFILPAKESSDRGAVYNTLKEARLMLKKLRKHYANADLVIKELWPIE